MEELDGSGQPSKTVTYAYDNNGNQTLKTVAVAGGGQKSTEFRYNTRDQLREVIADGETAATFFYDDLGRRIRKNAEYEHWDGRTLVAETAATGGVLRSYTHGLTLLRETVLGAVVEAYTDGMGSVGALVPQNGTAANAGHFRYDAYGNFRTGAHPGDCSDDPSGLTCNAPLTYTGHLYDQESNLFYFGARYYDPETGRFLTNDPVAGDALNPPSLHRYLYAYDSPMVFTDPWGEYALNDINERFEPNPNNIEDFQRLTSLTNQATNKGGAYESYRSEYEAIRAGAGEFHTRDFKRDARMKMFELYQKLFSDSDAQNNRGFIITEGAPKSLRVNVGTVLKDAATTWDIPAKERAVAFGGAVWGIAGPVLIQGAKYSNPISAGYFAYNDAKGAFAFGQHLQDVGWSGFSQETWEGIKKPFVEGDTFNASAEAGQAMFMVYGMVRPMFPSKAAAPVAAETAATRAEVLSENVAAETSRPRGSFAAHAERDMAIQQEVAQETAAAQGEAAPAGLADVPAQRYPRGPFDVPADSTSPANAGLSPSGPVKPYEVGPCDNLKARSVPGDKLDIHHAAQAHPMEQVVPGYDRSTAPTIAVPRAEHSQIPNIRGPYQGAPRELLARDIRNLRNFTNAPNRSLQELIELNKNSFPEAFSK